MSDFIETNKQYHSGFQVNEYRGKYSLIAAHTWTDREGNEKINQEWAEREVGRDKVMKRLPVSVEIGNSKEEAIRNLQLVIDKLKDEQQWAPREAYASRDDRPLPEDEVPF